MQQPRRHQGVRAAAFLKEMRRLQAVLQHGDRLAKVSGAAARREQFE